MLLCSSKISVVDSFTPAVFINLAIEWITNSSNYSFESFSWDGRSDFCIYGNNKEMFQCGLFDNGKICGVHFCSVDNRSIKWTSDFILDCSNHVLAFQLYRDASSDVAYVHRAFSLPKLIRMIISRGCCANDNNLKTDDKPIRICPTDIKWVSDMMLRKTAYDMPIVYMSCLREGYCIINPFKLAEALNGVAHVVYETSCSISLALREKANGVNPYGGAIEIFYPKGNKRLIPSQFDNIEKHNIYFIRNTLLGHMNQLQIEECYLWSHLQAEKLRNQLYATIQKKEKDSKEYSELERMYEEFLSEKNSQIKRLNEQLYLANLNIEQLENQISSSKNIPVICLGDESDLYPFEQQSYLIEIIQKELRNTDKKSRKAHILASLLEANRCDNSIGQKRTKLKKCLHGYTRMTSAVEKDLKELGFSIIDDGKHIKIMFSDDERYCGTLSKTGSDHRGGDNTAHDLIRQIF